MLDRKQLVSAKLKYKYIYTPEMELYIILANLENFEHWNQTHLIMKCHHLKQSQFSILQQW